MTSAVFDHIVIKALTGGFNIQANDTTTFCVLGTVAPNKSTWATYYDIKWAASSPFEIAAVGTDYPLGGIGMNTSVPTVTSTITGIKSSATVFATSQTIAGLYAIPQYAASSRTSTSNPVICYLDLGSGTGGQTVTNGTLTLTWNAAGVCTFTVSAAA